MAQIIHNERQVWGIWFVLSFSHEVDHVGCVKTGRHKKVVDPSIDSFELDLVCLIV